jgi:hypothetical protein
MSEKLKSVTFIHEQYRLNKQTLDLINIMIMAVNRRSKLVLSVYGPKFKFRKRLDT